MSSDHPHAAPATLRARALWLVAGPLSVGAWRDLVNMIVGVAFAGVYGLVLVACLIVSASVVWIVGLGARAFFATLWLARQMARSDRWRIGVLCGARISSPPDVVPVELSRAQRLRAAVRSRGAWRLVEYQFAHVLLAGAAAFAAVAWWWMTAMTFVLASGPAHPPLLLAWRLPAISPGPFAMIALVLAGIALILGWPLLLRATSALDVLVASAMIGSPSQKSLAAEVQRLSQARALALESAEAERRRIERDLHDGLQPRLVSLALDIGLARARMASDPAGAAELVARAHDEAKVAIEDLRALVRGIHPSVLDERGLDAAFSALVAACPYPVSIRVDLARRPPPIAESVAYFVVAEAITNVTKHAGASRAWITITEHGVGAGQDAVGAERGSEMQRARRADGPTGREADATGGSTLHVVVEDDGSGGASLDPGGGLEGLARRLASIDGSFELSSPPGGPTRLEAVIPISR